MRRVLWLVVVLFAATACPGNGEGSGDGGGSETTAATGRDDAPPGDTGSGAADSDYCAIVLEAGSIFAAEPTEGTDQEKARKLYRSIDDWIHRLAGAAPPEIADDFSVYLPEWEEFFAALEDVDFDLQRLSPEHEAFAANQLTGDVERANAAIEKYHQDHCGL